MIKSQVFSSVGIGLLIGILLGLSASPVVGLVVGAVSALLASLTGLKVPKNNKELVNLVEINLEQQKLIGIRAGFFGLTCVVGIFIGIFLRTHNILSPPEYTLKQQFEELTSIGFNPKEAREILVHRGLNSESPVTQNTVLFSSNLEGCEKIAIDRFETVSSAINYYSSINQNSLVSIATVVNQQIIEEERKKDIMRSITEALCTEE